MIWRDSHWKINTKDKWVGRGIDWEILLDETVLQAIHKKEGGDQ